MLQRHCCCARLCCDGAFAMMRGHLSASDLSSLIPTKYVHFLFVGVGVAAVVGVAKTSFWMVSPHLYA